jgi:hypothetical protein
MTVKEPLRINDAKKSIIFKNTSGCVLATTGLGLVVYSILDAFSSEMFVMNLLFVIFDGYFRDTGAGEVKEKYHDMNRELFHEVSIC